MLNHAQDVRPRPPAARRDPVDPAPPPQAVDDVRPEPPARDDPLAGQLARAVAGRPGIAAGRGRLLQRSPESAAAALRLVHPTATSLKAPQLTTWLKQRANPSGTIAGRTPRCTRSTRAASSSSTRRSRSSRSARRSRPRRSRFNENAEREQTITGYLVKVGLPASTMENQIKKHMATLLQQWQESERVRKDREQKQARFKKKPVTAVKGTDTTGTDK